MSGVHALLKNGASTDSLRTNIISATSGQIVPSKTMKAGTDKGTLSRFSTTTAECSSVTKRGEKSDATKAQVSAAKETAIRTNCAWDADKATAIQPAQRLAAPKSGSVAYTMATQSARIRAK